MSDRPAQAYLDLVREELDVGAVSFVSVDVEDYFHEVPGGERVFEERRLPSNLARNVESLLELFDAHGVKATFFVLGCAAHRIGQQLERIAAEGHEIASHGFGHERATWITREEFGEDLRRGKAAIEDLTGREVRGYRAPFFAVTDANLWALEEIRDAGFAYDSSVCPVKNFAYGIPTAPERPHTLANGLLEIPMSQVRMLGYRFMVSGGFYLRAYPWPLTRFLLARRRDELPFVLYIHPWEWDEPQLNVWDLGIDHPALEWRPRLMKWITTYNRKAALDRFGRLIELGPPARLMGEMVADPASMPAR